MNQINIQKMIHKAWLRSVEEILFQKKNNLSNLRKIEDSFDFIMDKVWDEVSNMEEEQIYQKSLALFEEFFGNLVK